MLRKGRVDEIFFVDLPNDDERREIFRIHLTKRKRDPAKFDLDDLARLSDGFSGAEIEEAIISGLYDAFSKGTDLDTAILKIGITETVPLSKTMSEELNRLRNWAQGRARPSTGFLKAPEPDTSETRRKLEI
jgi:SpoVK/Ycf46/Vps4 family AAA+-type ATPase